MAKTQTDTLERKAELFLSALDVRGNTKFMADFVRSEMRLVVKELEERRVAYKATTEILKGSPIAGMHQDRIAFINELIANLKSEYNL